MPNCVAVIPVRGNSKGIPRKNLIDLGGKPLFMWTVGAAIESGVFDKIVVSTEDDEIISYCDNRKVDVIFRPPYLSQDHVQLSEVVLHAYRIMEYEWAWHPTTLCLLQATSPLRTAGHIINAMRQYSGRGTLFSAYIDKRYHWAVEDRVEPIQHNPARRLGRQWEPSQIYTENGAIYFFPAKRFSLECTIRLEPFDVYIMDEEDGFEIDTPWQLDIARLRLEKYGLHFPELAPQLGP